MSAYLRGDRVLPIGIPFTEENVQGLTLFGAKVGRELAEEDGTPPCSENLNNAWMLLVMIYILIPYMFTCDTYDICWCDTI